MKKLYKIGECIYDNIEMVKGIIVDYSVRGNYLIEVTNDSPNEGWYALQHSTLSAYTDFKSFKQDKTYYFVDKDCAVLSYASIKKDITFLEKCKLSRDVLI